MSFGKLKFKVLMRCSLSLSNFLIVNIFGDNIPKKSLPIHGHKDFPLCFLMESRSFIVLGHM